MKIGFDGRVLVSPEMRGLARYTVGLLRALSAVDGIELILFSNADLCPDHLQGVRAKVVVFKAPRELVWNDLFLPKMIRREGVEVFHAPADRGLPALKPCPLVVTVHESYERLHWWTLFPGLKPKIWYWKHELVNYALADAVLTVSETTRRKLISLRVAPPRKLHRIYPAPFPEFCPGTCAFDELILRKYQISMPYFLCVGGYDARKNIETLVQAFSVATVPEYLLVVVGEHRYGYAKLVERWRTHPCFSRLRLIEAHTHDLPALYRRAHLFIQPSMWESFSFPIVEALRCGTPTLASGRTAIPEIAGGAAVLFNPEDPAGLARLIEHVAADAALRRELQAKGYDRARAFSWMRVAEETLQVYRRVASKPAIETSLERPKQ